MDIRLTGDCDDCVAPPEVSLTTFRYCRRHWDVCFWARSGHGSPAWAKCTFRQYRRIARCGRAADLGFLRFSNRDIHAPGTCSGPRRGCRSRAPGRPGAVGDSVPTNSNQVRKTCDGSCSAKRLARSRCFRMISAASVPSPARIAFATARCSVFDLARMSGVNAPLS